MNASGYATSKSDVRTFRLSSLLVVALTTSLVASASAELPKKVMREFKGKLLVTTGAPLSTEFESDAEMIRAYKKANVKVLPSYGGDEGVAVWSFYIMAFMKEKPRAKSLSLDFYLVQGGKKTYVANQRLMGINPSLMLLSTRVELSEDDNLNKGRTYEVRLTTTRGKREVVLAKTTIRTR